MTRLEILKDALSLAQNTLYCASKDYLCTRPWSDGLEPFWREQKEKVNILEKWIDEIVIAELEERGVKDEQK